MNKFKVVAMVLISINIIVGVTGNVEYIANASVSQSEADILFFKTISEIFDYELKDEGSISVTKDRLYDVKLNELGLLYEFEYKNNKGFAILINDGVMQIAELYTEGISPYKHSESKNIYVTQGIYWYYNNVQFYDCVTELPISENAYGTLSEVAYSGEINTRFETERVEFQYRTENKYNIIKSIPNCQYSKAAGCVPLAATNLIVYYDKTFPNLISEYEPGRTVFGNYIYNSENSTTMSVCDTLYNDMGTSSFLSGTSVSQFRSGLKKYINRQGYDVEYGSLMSQSKFNFEIAKETVQSNVAMVLFMKEYQALQINKYDGYDIIEYEITDSNHAVAGFGCLEVVYTVSGNLIRKDEYVYASLGTGVYGKGYINAKTAQINDALSVHILGG